ncbi:SLC13 family permease [Metabacillus rhizolycopersici]|uniref:Anion permease n=1 Tax=Metabacillus rhizolycopersici TaxID=2875709 RepID=A0ABS7UNQ8_9BACI|nr:SLC13 family permease [Metabacillus rhizolycopersici]MBZ5749672.1 anion permease [Metabacillus rhizolycopersici]
MITRMEHHIKKHIENHNRIKIWINQLSIKSLVIISIHVLVLLVIVLIDGLDYRAKISLFAFLSAMTLWITTKIPAGFVAITLIMFIVIMNAEDPELLYHSLSEEVVWLMVGSFIIGEAVKQSGLAERLTFSILRKFNKKSNVLLGVSSILFASVFFIPSTSGRAALSMPIINQLSQKFSTKEQSVLAILAPVIILMSTSATIIGAGSHLIGIGLLESTVDQSISYIDWLIWGVPFTLVITLFSFFIIKWMLWPKDEFREIENVQTEDKMMLRQPINGKEKKTVILMSFLIVGWMTESVHGYDIAFITMVGAILVMMPNYGIISWKQGMKSISWNLIVFVAAATALGKVLVDSGVVKWIEKEMLNVLHMFIGAPEWFIVFIILLVTVSSHLYITSHTTRAIVFIPSLLLFSETIGVNPSTVVFLSLIGMNYCVTVPVSSKALLLFYEEGETSYDASNLLKISAILMPLYILVMMLFYFSYWQWAGMHL